MKSKESTPKPEAHLTFATLVIGSLAMLLTGGLGLLRMLDRIDFQISRWLGTVIPLTFSQDLPSLWVWLFTAVAAYGVVGVILCARGGCRRWLFWVSALSLVLFWAPVLVLAAYEPKIAAPFIAALWSGICAMVYVGKHRMPGEN